MKPVVRNGLIAAGLLVAALGTVLYLGGYELRRTPPATQKAPSDPALAARGAYLARAGDCMACHTARGGAAYAGGRAIATPFGRIVSPNITSDVRTGIGAWSADDFWRALHHGKSRNGRLLYPAFPYTNYTRVTRADADALHAYFMSVPAVNAPSQAHDLRFPYNQQLALAAWRALYFRPAEFRADPQRDANWNRGAYLVEGLGHCSACHSSRNALGATTADSTLAGGVIPMLGWYAPSLDSSMEAGLGQWPREHIVALLKNGVSDRAAVFGPMAEVVRESLQHLSDADLGAMAVYLKSIPEAAPADPPSRPGVNPDDVRPMLTRGAALYKTHCASCHGDDGAGQSPGYPALAGNRNINMAAAINPIRVVLAGGFPPGTAGNPRPYGMPPFGAVLDDEATAAVVSYIRTAWGNGKRVGEAAYVSPVEVNRLRSAPLD
jgi:mono/diheme cytochrome c family protein